MLLIDGVRYNLHKYRTEEEFEQTIKEHSKDIFGEESLYCSRSRIKSPSGICSIPDGYAIICSDKPRWYVVEIELSTHPIFDHRVNQKVGHMSWEGSESGMIRTRVRRCKVQQ